MCISKSELWLLSWWQPNNSPTISLKLSQKSRGRNVVHFSWKSSYFKNLLIQSNDVQSQIFQSHILFVISNQMVDGITSVSNHIFTQTTCGFLSMSKEEQWRTKTVYILPRPCVCGVIHSGFIIRLLEWRLLDYLQYNRRTNQFSGTLEANSRACLPVSP